MLRDVNADGKLDLMTANYSGGSVSVMLGQGNGVFGAATNYAVGPNPLGVAAGDVNGDGHADIVATDDTNSVVWVLAGTGTGTFAAGVTHATGNYPTDVVIVDATGDGRADILTANAVGTVSLLKQQANGTLAAKVDITVGTSPFALTVADMDQDGIADLVTANQLVDTVSVLKGLGGGAFSAKTDYSVQQQSGIYRPFAVTTGDLNGDGNADVVVGNWLDYYYGTGNWNVSVLLRKGPSVENFRYDAGGVRTGAGSGGAYVAGDNNELDADGKYSYQYDKLGNLSLRTEIATGKVTEYAWDNHNRLTKVTYKASAGGTVTGTAEYGYDMNGRRIRRKVDVDGQAGFEIDERFAYDGAQWDLALVFDAAGSLTNRYLSTDAVDAALAEDDFAGGAANATEWLQADHQGSVRDIVRETGTEVTHVAYDSFGNVTNVTGTAPVAPRIGYTGQERDPETGLMYYGARYYDPRTGRFLSQDPTGFDAGDANLYRYVHNSPVIYIDPTGLRLFSPVQQAFNFVSNTIGNAFNSWGNSLSNLGRAAWTGAANVGQTIAANHAADVAQRAAAPTLVNRPVSPHAAPAAAPRAIPSMRALEQSWYQRAANWWATDPDKGDRGAEGVIGPNGTSIHSFKNNLVKPALEGVSNIVGASWNALAGAYDFYRHPIEGATNLLEKLRDLPQSIPRAYNAAVERWHQSDTIDMVRGTVRVGTEVSVPAAASGAFVRRVGQLEIVTPQSGTPSGIPHGNSLRYVGDTHVYVIRGPNGPHKIGQSMQGVRAGDGASIRGELQARQLSKRTGDQYFSEIRRTFSDKASAVQYESTLIDRFRRMFGKDTLPGNKTNR